MTRPVRLLLVPIAFLIVAIVAARSTRADDEEQKPIKVTLHPAPVSQPALKYQLLPDFMERIDGNAIVYLGLVKSEQNAFFGNRKLQENIDEWQSEPLDKLRDVEPFLRTRENGPLYYLDQAARCTHSDWQLPLGRESYYSMMLPGIQESRQFARILCAHARIALAHGDQAEAFRDLQTCYALSLKVADNETLVAALVGMAISGIASEQVLTLIQQPDAPNLYWSLTQLPRPFIDLRQALDAEMHALELSFPEIRNIDEPRTPDEWRIALFKVSAEMPKWIDFPRMQTTPEGIMAISMRTYPRAKRALIDAGLSAQAVEAMPVAEVILRDEIQRFHGIRDDIAKGFSLPYPQARRGLDEARDAIKQVVQQGEAIPLVEVFMPGIEACRTAQMRCDRKIAALRVLEALRLYAASHDGQLPQKLADVTEVPIPNDPMTEAPFQYELTGNLARLSGPKASNQLFEYEVTMSPAK